jgi:hypothetical protein
MKEIHKSHSKKPLLNKKKSKSPLKKNKSKSPRKWSDKYKKSIDCTNPKGFSQRQHCLYGRK